MRKILGYLSLAILSACGFEPLYGPQSSESLEVCEELAQVKIARIPDREGQILRNHLIDTLTPCGQPVFPCAILNVQLDIQRVDVAVRKDGTALRYKVTLVASFELTDPETKKVFYADKATVVDAYYIGGDSAFEAYSTIISERDAVKKGIKVLADKIQLLLASYYKENGVKCHENPEAP